MVALRAGLQRVIVEVLTAVGSDSLKLPRRRHRGSVLQDVSAGRWLRQECERFEREMARATRRASRSVVICSGLGSSADDLAAELLVRMSSLLQIRRVASRKKTFSSTFIAFSSFGLSFRARSPCHSPFLCNSATLQCTEQLPNMVIHFAIFGKQELELDATI
jgi:hypothetical protein